MNAPGAQQWRRKIAEHLECHPDDEHVDDVCLVVEQWRHRRDHRPVHPPHVEREHYRAALSHLEKAKHAICRARGTAEFQVNDPRPFCNGMVAPGVALASLEAFLAFNCAESRTVTSRTKTNSVDALLVQQLALIWRHTGRRVPKTLDKDPGPFGRFVEAAAGESISRKAGDRALRHLHVHADINE